MGKKTLEFPIKHVDGNLVFGKDGTVTAYFHVSGFNYDFLDHFDKFIPFNQQTAFLFNNISDLHFISEPFPTNVEEIIDSTLEDMEHRKYVLKGNGKSYMEMVRKSLLERKKMSESTESNDFIGVQLDHDKRKIKDSNVGKNLISNAKEFIKGLNSQINRAAGLHANDILESEIVMWHEQAETMRNNLQTAFSCPVRPITTAETVYLVEKEFSVIPSNADVFMRRDFQSGKQVEGMDEEGRSERAIRPKEKAFLDLQMTNIEEVSPTTLKFSKLVDDDIEEIYTKYLVVSNMNSENYFPSFEWLYNMKSTLSFPVSASVRAYHQDNAHITKRLSNKRLEYQDQRDELRKGGGGQDLNLDMSEAGTIQAESYFAKTGQPAYSLSIVFKITAKEKKELNKRAEKLRNELTKYGVKVENPFGEQLSLMQERILGGHQVNNDYKIDSDIGIIAGMMFGATTNIGDNRGFYIGSTDKNRKPVFIQPDLAAKAFDGLGNIEDSISQLFAGKTGKGKSFAMNLITYLSVLSGSQALIIDPKGDRKGWSQLPQIPSKFISKWTLGESDMDAGCLDPFRTTTDAEEGKTIALDICSYLAGVGIQDTEYAVLGEMIQQVGNTADPCIGQVIEKLNVKFNNRPEDMTNRRYEAIEKLHNTFSTLKNNNLSNLLFGEVGQDYRSLNVEVPLQILMVQNLDLPNQSTKVIRPSHQISEAILISITSFTKQYMLNSDRSIHKVILQDEASSIDNSPIGRELMDFIVRKGRYYNTTLIKGSQNATDHGNDVANMGMKFSFGLSTNEEATRMLEYLNLPTTQGNVQKLKELPRGKCLFQDIYGRTAIITIDPVFKELFDAFDSSTSSEEEKERERSRQVISRGETATNESSEDLSNKEEALQGV
ncbi:ATP-binding protein [Halobacillus locisalis]|uniref:ATP-binding protein n=1 Tax=Halobacillus locisalis TaxID=220753 RepID=A0A838CXM1_9BACI|nr:ATP-binding protein [Halobacillus locisalis]MBA2176892.1 ATP-binding protein [Halobacillus locisalis]